MGRIEAEYNKPTHSPLREGLTLKEQGMFVIFKRFFRICLNAQCILIDLSWPLLDVNIIFPPDQEQMFYWCCERHAWLNIKVFVHLCESDIYTYQNQIWIAPIETVLFISSFQLQ